MSQKILYFFPLNPADNNTGSCRRALGLLQYFKEKRYEVVFISQEDWGQWTDEREKAFNKLQLASKSYILQRKPVKKNPIAYFFKYKFWHFWYDLKLGKSKAGLPNHTTLHLVNQFNKILQDHRFDTIIISYAYWAHLIYNNALVKDIPCILDTHDFLTAQHLQDADTQRGQLFDDEINRMSFFKSIWAISPEEHYLFSQMVGPRVKYVPAWIEDPWKNGKQPKDERKFDLLYVATDNPHNLRSISWFLDEVLPLLPKNINMLMVGTINKHVTKTYANITKIDYIDDLSEVYGQSRIAICPMQSGTGVKIKVIEALAYGLPVVCQPRGLDGIPIRYSNGCLAADHAEAFAQHIARLLQDRDFYAQTAAHARKCYQDCFSQQVGYSFLDEAFASIETDKP